MWNMSGIVDEYWFELSNIPGGVTDLPTKLRHWSCQTYAGWFSRPRVRVAEREYSPIGERDSYAGFVSRGRRSRVRRFQDWRLAYDSLQLDDGKSS